MRTSDPHRQRLSVHNPCPPPRQRKGGLAGPPSTKGNYSEYYSSSPCVHRRNIRFHPPASASTRFHPYPLILARPHAPLLSFTTGYTYLVQILPVLVVSPLYFAGSIELGVITQSTGAFNHVLNDLSIIVNQFEGISSFSAGLNRLGSFVERMETYQT